MSVIVWDGKTLAADRQATNGNLSRSITKIWRQGDLLVGGTGDAVAIQALLNWVSGGCKIEAFPEMCRNPDDVKATLVVIDRAGTLRRFENGPYPLTYHDEIFACGSGCDFAYGAMAMGADASRAVEVASEFDIYCGRGVDTLAFEPACELVA